MSSRIVLLLLIHAFCIAYANCVSRSSEHKEDRRLQGLGRVENLRLINAVSDTPILNLTNGTIIDLAQQATSKFNIEAIIVDGAVGSVRFGRNGKVNFRTISVQPFAFCGMGVPLGNFLICSILTLGQHNVTATPYSGSSASGMKGDSFYVSFSIINSNSPTKAPTKAPTKMPTKAPTKSPTKAPSEQPTKAPTKTPTKQPTKSPSKAPTKPPTKAPTKQPTKAPTKFPTKAPTKQPTKAPSKAPTKLPTKAPSRAPTKAPTKAPTDAPVILPEGQWIEVNPNATIAARHEACFVMVGNKAYLLAGRGVKVVNIYNPVTRKWTSGPAPPMEIHHTQCVVADDKIWIVSSWTGSYPRESNTPLIFIYDTTTNTWSNKTGLPEPRRRGGAAAVLVGRKIYVSHGNRGGHETGNFSTTLGWLDYYDIDLDGWVTNLPNAPNPRDHTGGAYVNGRICVAGGRDGGSVGFFNLTILPTDCYDPVTNTWTVEANIPQGRAGSSYGRTCDGKLMVAGGEGYGQAWPNVDVFDGTAWTSIDSLNVARHGSGLAVDCRCNQIHIASGSKSQGAKEIKSVETFFPGGVDVPCPAP